MRCIYDSCSNYVPAALPPLLLDNACPLTIIKQFMDMVMNAVEHFTAGSTPIVIIFGQLLFASAKQIQRKWPHDYNEEKFVILLHIEMARLKTLHNWLHWSRWVRILVQTEIANAGTADSFLRASYDSLSMRT